MPVVRKVQSKANLSARPAVSVERKKDSGTETSDQESGVSTEARRTKKVCFFCKNKVEPAHWDMATLRRVVNDRGRISPRTRTGACAKHQRRVSREVKRARILSLLPFSSRI